MSAGGVRLAPNVRSVLVFGGSFDPPHVAHMVLARAARDAVGADVLLYVPAARSPLKQGGPVASGEERLAMLRLAVADDAKSAVSSVEIDRAGPGPSYTVDTLRELSAAFGKSVALRLLIGADQAADFHRWREPDTIVALAEPVVMLRAPSESWEGLAARLKGHWPEAEIARWGRRVVNVPMMDVSATRVRALLASGAKDCELGGAVPASVLRYVREHGLYGAVPGRE